MDISQETIDLLNESRTESELNEEFQSITKRINQILNQTEFDVNNGEYIYKEHCNELRRQVQLAKETQIQQIEEITDKLMNEIDQFEKESLETVSKVNKEQLVNKLNEMKQENEKWNPRLDEFKVDNQMLNQLRDSLSKIAVERDNFNSLLHNKMLKFKAFNDESFVGELSRVSLDSLDQILLQKQIEEIEKRYFLEDEDPIFFEFKEGKILSNGDLFLCGEMKDQKYNSYDVILAIFDSKKDFKFKKIKQLCVKYQSMAMSSDRICLTYEIKEESDKCIAREETEDDEEYEETNDEVGDYVVLILDEKLEKLHRFKSHKMNSIGANDSFLFFNNDSKHKDGAVSFYTWSLEYVKTIGQSNDPNLPFYFPKQGRKLVNMFGRYYLMDDSCFKFKIIDEETGILLKTIDKTLDFWLDNNYNCNLILSNQIDNSTKHLSFNGDLLKEIKIGNYCYSFLLNNDKRCLTYNLEYNQLYFLNKYDENTHEVV